MNALNSGTRWVLEQLNGQAVEMPAGTETPNMQLNMNEKKLEGFGGCNNFFGNFFLDGDKVNISELGSTKKMCAATSKTEGDLMMALRNTEKYKLNDGILTLLQDDKVLAKFKAE